VQIYGAVPGGFIDRRSAGFSPLSP